MQNFIQLIAATAGSAGFAALFNIRGKKLIFAILGGFFTWAVYLAAAYFNPNPYLCGFISSVMLTLYAECMARIHKTPATVFLVSAAIPLFPGAALYRAMNCLMQKDWPGFTSEGTYALLFAACMSTGITLTTIIFQNIWERLAQRHPRIKTCK